MQLQTSCLLNVPFQTYDNDFTFIINGKEFKTSRLVSDLLSPVICHIHSNDPTSDIFTINTSQDGDFSHFLNLVNFRQYNFQEDEYPFIAEVLEILGNESIKITQTEDNVKITKDNIIDLTIKHEKHSQFYQKDLSSDIDFISSHFFALCESQAKDFKRLQIETLQEIVSSPKLQIKDEDQLLHFINELYQSDPKYSILYEFVYFTNVSAKTITEFAYIVDMNDITSKTWQNVSNRLICDIMKPNEPENEHESRYVKRRLTFAVNEQQEFAGIINYLRTKSNEKIDDEINFTSSSKSRSDDVRCLPRNVALFDDHDKFFVSSDEPNSWICLDFKEHRVIPSDYTIRSYNYKSNGASHLKSWVIECSNDNDSWTVVDKHENESCLNGPLYSRTFKIKQENSEEYRYIRIRQTSENWVCHDYLIVESFEIYGTYI